MPIVETIQPDWQDVVIETFSKGLDNYNSFENIDKKSLTVSENVNVEKDLLVGDLGYFPYKYITTALTANAVAGQSFILIPNGAWHLVNGGKVAITLNNGTIFVATGTPISSDRINISPVMPSQANTGKAVNIEVRVVGTPFKFHKLELSNGQASYFILTTKTLYKDTNTSYFEPIGLNAGPATTIASSAISEGQATVTVANTAGFAVGDVIRILGDNGAYFPAIISAITPGAPGTLLFAGYPFWDVAGASIGNAVRKCVTLTGTLSDRLQALSIPWADQMMFTNGVDQIQLYSNSTGYVADGGPANTKCKNLAIFDSSVFLISTIEGGTAYRQRVKYCDKADITNWTTGVSGAIDLYDSTKECLAGKVLGPYLYIYRRKGIHRISISQRGDRRFDYDMVLSSHGIIGSDAVMDVSENEHLLVDEDNIFSYTGGYTADPIGDPIRDIIFGLYGNIDTTKYPRVSILYQPELKAAMVCYQPVGGSGPKVAYRVSIKEKAWTKRLFPSSTWCIGRGNATSSITWNTITGTWGGTGYTWESTYLSASADNILLAAGENPSGGIYIYQGTRYDDAGSTISYKIQTKNFVEVSEVRIDWIDIWCTGNLVYLYYSTDRGTSWQLYGIISGSYVMTRYRIEKQFIASQYMFKFESSNTVFSILRMQARITPETERK